MTPDATSSQAHAPGRGEGAGSVRDADAAPLGPGAIPDLQALVPAGHLEQVRRSASELSGLHVTILDADHRPLVPPDPPADATLFEAPVAVEELTLGFLCARAASPSGVDEEAEHRFRDAASELGLDGARIERLAEAARRCHRPDATVVQSFLHGWAATLSELCARGIQLHHRVAELATVYELSTMLAAHRDLQQVLEVAARTAARVMRVKAASIRLLDDQGHQLVPRAVYNLSRQYLDKGPILVERSELYRRTLRGEIVYVADMASDPRVLYPEDARREGLVSILGAPMIYQDRPIGVVRLYTGRPRAFSRFEIDMLRAVAQLLAAAIANARLYAEHEENERVQRQVRLAAAVQRRMIPAAPPTLPGFDIAARCLPSFELGGDFYDFIPLGGHTGIALGDVAGKGVAASLLMASVRSALRAYAQDVYDLTEIIARVNVALTRDTLDREFATLFYGVIDPARRRLTYTNAGHEPPLLLRRNEIRRLEVGGMVVGVDEAQAYDKGVLDLQRGDLLLIHTDGLSDAQNFKDQRFGRDRVMAAMHAVAEATAAQALNHLVWEMRRFVGLRHSTDDTTLVVVKVK